MVSKPIMSYFACIDIRFKTLFFIVWAILCSLCSKGQSDPVHSFLNITQDKDDESVKIVQQSAAKDDSVANVRKKFYSFIYLDIGSVNLNSSMNTPGGLNESANGQTFALCWQAAHKFT